MMRHEKIFKRKDGSRVKIVTDVYVDFRGHWWHTEFWICAPRKKTFYNVVNRDDYGYRSLSMEAREEFSKREGLTYATPEEVQSVCLELWEQIKPNSLTPSHNGR